MESATTVSLKPRLLTLASIALLGAAVFSGCSDSDDDGGGGSGGGGVGTVKVGALLPMTGALASYGETSKAALEDLVATINKDSSRLEIDIQDTKSEPPTALSLLQDMHDDDISIVVGPYSSSEVTAVKQYADQNGIILLSPLSTATSLAVPDNIFRFTPDDAAEGAALAALAYADNVRTMVTFSRDDPGNLGLQSSFKSAFERLGGRVVQGVTYPPTESDFKDEVERLAGVVVNEVMTNSGGARGNVGVYLTAFNEVTSIFPTVADNGGDGLRSVAWYGSDSVALSKELVANAKAAQFAAGAGYPNPILGLRDSDKAAWEPVSNRVSQKLSRTPDAFALAAYDALNVAYQVMTNAGERDLAAKRAELISITNAATGLTGPLRLSDAGDRSFQIYDFWAVCSKNNAWTWYRSATYDPAGGARRLGAC